MKACGAWRQVPLAPPPFAGRNAGCRAAGEGVQGPAHKERIGRKGSLSFRPILWGRTSVCHRPVPLSCGAGLCSSCRSFRRALLAAGLLRPLLRRPMGRQTGGKETSASAGAGGYMPEPVLPQREVHKKNGAESPAWSFRSVVPKPRPWPCVPAVGRNGKKPCADTRGQSAQVGISRRSPPVAPCAEAGAPPLPPRYKYLRFRYFRGLMYFR